jgi:hypothetical protein
LEEQPEKAQQRSCLGKPHGEIVMSIETQPELTPAERVHDVARILDAINQGVHAALLRHKQAGVPIAVWRNERVEWIAAEDLNVDDVDSSPSRPMPEATPRSDRLTPGQTRSEFQSHTALHARTPAL